MMYYMVDMTEIDFVYYGYINSSLYRGGYENLLQKISIIRSQYTLGIL